MAGLPSIEVHARLVEKHRMLFARYWIVQDAGTTGGDQTVGDGTLETMIAEYEAEPKDEETTQLRVGGTKEGLDRDSTKLGQNDGMGPAFRVGGQARDRARAAKKRQVEDPDQVREDAHLKQLAESFDREIERYCCRLDSVPRETLQLLASISPTALEVKPFGRKGREASMAKYRSVGHRYLGFCFRAYKQGREEALERWAVTQEASPTLTTTFRINFITADREYTSTMSSALDLDGSSKGAVLNGPCDWKQWISIIKKFASSHNVWEYLDPSIKEDQSGSIRDRGSNLRGVSSSRIPPHPIPQQIASVVKAIASLQQHIVKTIGNYYSTIAEEHDVTMQLSLLQARVAPTDWAFEREVLQRYRSTLQSPERTKI
ncbi:hypothetical protein HIM_09900 [Hirsutella minnesotensis 3608]|uniref:Uncharacterized protein n=1 Tax=Hirsutella minnesotensis 3608 TaxID=1043627 RepID=A0A0F7ZGD8_9HYPO|nr:hypothetical protein HIM_09900 [Hirsutella minnesotensis 3608]